MNERLLDTASDPIWWLTTFVLAILVGVAVNIISTYGIDPWWSRRREQAKARLQMYEELSEKLRMEPRTHENTIELTVGLQVITLIRIEAFMQIVFGMFMTLLVVSAKVLFLPNNWFFVAFTLMIFLLGMDMLIRGHKKHMQCLQAEFAVFSALSSAVNKK